MSDSDGSEARETRAAFCETRRRPTSTVLGTRFHHPAAGRIVRHAEASRFAVRG